MADVRYWWCVQPRPTATLSLGVILLAAGASSRMGRPKLLLPWGRTSILGHLIQEWQSLRSAQIAVVCAPGDQALQAELDRLRFPAASRIVNPAPERGMFSSIQSAAAWCGWQPALTHWVVVLGDQPHVQRETLRQTLDFASAHPDQVCQPSRSGHGRHPVILPERVFRELAATSTETLKAFLTSAGHALARCEMDDPGLDLDIDRPEDYERAKGWAAA